MKKILTVKFHFSVTATVVIVNVNVKHLKPITICYVCLLYFIRHLFYWKTLSDSFWKCSLKTRLILKEMEDINYLQFTDFRIPCKRLYEQLLLKRGITSDFKRLLHISRKTFLATFSGKETTHFRTNEYFLQWKHICFGFDFLHFFSELGIYGLWRSRWTILDWGMEARLVETFLY